MNIFDHPNMAGFKCSVCGTNTDKPVTLVPVEGTEVKGSMRMIAEQVHIECIDLRIVMLDSITNHRLIVQEI